MDGPTWTEAQEFVRRLSMKTGKQYRLPSEAEWEYAARAGSTSDYLTSNDPAEFNRYAWYSQNSAKTTQLVGQKQANAFGLHDVIGNVYEWMQDCYIDHHKGAPADGSAVPGNGWTVPAWSRAALTSVVRPIFGLRIAGGSGPMAAT